MEFSLIELNELIYAVGSASRYGNLVNKKVANRLWARLNDELDRRCKLLDMAENGPNCEYSGLPSPEAYKEPESMFDDVWTKVHDAEFERDYPQHQPEPAVVKELLDEAGAVQRWG